MANLQLGSLWNVQSLNKYRFGTKEVNLEASVADRLARMKQNYMKEGMQKRVEGILMVQEHNHSHILMLQIGNTFCKLPGGRLKPEIEGLKRNLTSKLAPPFVFPTPPDWQGKRFLHRGGERRNCRTKASDAGTENTGSSERPLWQSKIKDLSRNSAVTAVRSFPWEKVCVRFIQRVLDLVQMVVKWLAIPVLAFSALSEILYTLTAKKDIFIPLGILTGVLLAKIVGNASLDVVKELQDGRGFWPLIALGMFFVLLKLAGPYYPSWAAAFLPHVANAGLVQTAFLLRKARLMFV